MYFKLLNEPDLNFGFYHYVDFESIELPDINQKNKFVEYNKISIDSNEHVVLPRSIKESFYVLKNLESDYFCEWLSLIKALSPAAKNKRRQSSFSCWFNEDGCDIRVYPQKFKSGDFRLDIAMTKTPLIHDLESSKKECIKFIKWLINKSKELR